MRRKNAWEGRESVERKELNKNEKIDMSEVEEKRVKGRVWHEYVSLCHAGSAHFLPCSVPH